MRKACNRAAAAAALKAAFLITGGLEIKAELPEEEEPTHLTSFYYIS